MSVQKTIQRGAQDLVDLALATLSDAERTIAISGIPTLTIALKSKTDALITIEDAHGMQRLWPIGTVKTYDTEFQNALQEFLTQGFRGMPDAKVQRLRADEQSGKHPLAMLILPGGGDDLKPLITLNQWNSTCTKARAIFAAPLEIDRDDLGITLH